MPKYFEKVTPQSVGNSDENLLALTNRLSENGSELHSLMVIRHGKCCAEAYWNPYNASELHPLFSFSKSLTCLSIGFAVQEGELSTDERLADIFPDKLPQNPNEYLLRSTVEDLLTMSCGQNAEIALADKSTDWIKEFFTQPFIYEPGTVFRYNTAGSCLLAAVLKRKTGQDVTEYLRPRLLEPLGIERLPCVHLQDPEMIELAGAGMKLTTEDMAKVALFVASGGRWEDRQILNEEWLHSATSWHIETAPQMGAGKENSCGYGYQFWMGSESGSYRADGAYGQTAYIYPDRELIVVTTGACDDLEIIASAVAEFAKTVQGEPIETESTSTFDKTAECFCIPALHGVSGPNILSQIEGVTYKPQGECSSLERIIGGVGLFVAEEDAVTQMSFNSCADGVTWRVWEDGSCKAITASVQGSFYINKIDGRRSAGAAKWRSFTALEMEIRRLDAASGVRLIFRLSSNDNEKLLIEADDTVVTADGPGILTSKASKRNGIQVTVELKAGGKESLRVKCGQTVRFKAHAEVPKGAGVVVGAEFTTDGNPAFEYPCEFKLHDNGKSAVIKAVCKYDKPGTYYATVRVKSSKDKEDRDPFVRVQNIAMAKVVVE